MFLNPSLREVEAWRIGEACNEAGSMQQGKEGAKYTGYRKTKKVMYSVTKGIAMPATRATRFEERMAGIRP